MQEKNFLSVDECSELTGKSKNIINNFVKKNFKNDDQLITNSNKNSHQNIIRKKAPKGFFWFIEEKFLLENFNILEKKENSNLEIVELLKQQLETQNSQIKNKDEQMKKKDEQISQLLERQRESNILLKNSQEKNLLLEEKNQEKEKKGFWGNFFG